MHLLLFFALSLFFQNPPVHKFDNHSIKTTRSDPAVSSSAIKVVHERYHSETSTVSVYSSDKSRVHTAKLANQLSNISLHDSHTTVSVKQNNKSLSESPLKPVLPSSATPTLHSYSSFSSLQSMENTTNYSIDTNSTTCYSLPEISVKSINSKNNSSNNNIVLLDANMSSTPLAKVDKPSYIYPNQSQQVLQKKKLQHTQCQQKQISAGYTLPLVDKGFNIDSECSQIPQQYQVYAPHAEHSKSSSENDNNSNNKTMPQSRMERNQDNHLATEFKYPATSSLVQQRVSPKMMNCWPGSGSDQIKQDRSK